MHIGTPEKEEMLGFCSSEVKNGFDVNAAA
jgi:hypothetical protein